MLVVVLGTWGFTVIGTMFSALTVNIRLREVMLPLLVYPTMIPCLMAAMELSKSSGRRRAARQRSHGLDEVFDRL